MKYNPIGIEGVIPKIPILLRHNPKISLQKPIDSCRSTKSPLDTNFQLPGTSSLILDKQQTNKHTEQLCF